jgi:Fuc2NAc and GlcNAc transferase
MLVWFALPGAFFFSCLLCGLLIRLGRAWLLDVPVARSAHTRSTPRGGGVAIVLTTYLFLFLLNVLGLLSLHQFLVLLCALPVAGTGLVDDLRSLPVFIRLPIHVMAAGVALYLLGPVPDAFFSGLMALPDTMLSLILVLALVWLLNLYNFMDGIDMLAAGQGLFVTAAAGIMLMAAQNSLAWVCAGLFAAILGFMVWNRSPARLFMGDVGSTFMGFFLGLLGLLSHFSGTLSVWVWVLLMGVFIADTTSTLLRRLLTRQRIFEAHSTHAYQHLARSLNSHVMAAALIGAVNVFWLLPLACLAFLQPQYGVLLSLSGIVPLMVLASVLGAGTQSMPAWPARIKDVFRTRNQDK